MVAISRLITTRVDVEISLSTSLVEGDILNCIVEFPRYALLHVEATLFLYGWVERASQSSVKSQSNSGDPHVPLFPPRHG
jgi:hypothetical protein